MVEDSDPVSIGIREWQKVKAAAEEAIERARVATEEASYLRGQCELLTQQHKTDETNLRRLQQHCDEMSLMVDSLGAAVLSVIEKRKAGFFRKAGSNPNNGGIERIRPAIINKPTDEDNLREIAQRLAPAAERIQPQR